MSKSTWGSMYVGDKASQSAAASYFGGMAHGCEILHAECLEHNETGREMKLRAIGRDKDGKLFEFIRTLSRNYTVTCRPASPRRLRDAGISQGASS